MPSPLDHPVESLPGIGSTTGARLRERGYSTVADLMWLLPRGYDDQRYPTPIHELRDGEYAVVRGIVRSSRSFPPGGKVGFHARVEPIGEPEEHDGYRELKLVWFSAIPGLGRRFAEGNRVRVAGRVQDYRGSATLAHPEILAADAPGAIEARYPEVPGVGRKTLRKAIRAAVDRASGEVADLIPPALRVEYRLSPVADALRAIHRPGPDELGAVHDLPPPGYARLALEELVLWELALRLRRATERGEAAQSFPREPLAAACEAFPFELTQAQRRAVSEIGVGLESVAPMKRLLQGDVGCGKTAVALVACAQVSSAGAQSVLLAPTELLAEQHAETLRETTEALGLRLGLFTGSISRDRRRSMFDRMSTGAVDLVVGTHALLSAEVQFSNLGLVIIDEQHRFGVAQRLRMGSRGSETRPHLLVMTATPIPRSLALVVYAGLELSVIDAKPPGRVPPTTRMCSRKNRRAVLRQIERALEAGGRAFVVCPAISGSSDMVTVERTALEMRRHFGEARVAEVHGRLPGEVRRDVMRAFSDGVHDILVGTTVLEVGIDVPDANIVIVEQSDRFGLAQLHQLRGRVGRGGQNSACLLTFDEPLTEDAEARLRALCDTDDGFELAERDLEIRGAGHLFGTRQSGASGLRFAHRIQDRALLEQAASIVDRIMESDPGLVAEEHAVAKRAILRWERTVAVREDAG